jgi:uncharacterized protein (TIGR03085 family)
MARRLFDGVERAELCALLDELGPDAGTALAPWTTRDLAAHLYLREHDSLAAPGLVLPGPWGRLAERRRLALAAGDYTALVSAVATGPRGPFRLRWMRRVPNLNEFFVHHEDVRRANALPRRQFDTEMNQALWANLRSAAWLLTRRLRGPGLQVRNTLTGQVATARRGSPVVSLVGEPGELLLYLFGRQAVARVDLEGPADAIAVVEGTKIGM